MTIQLAYIKVMFPLFLIMSKRSFIILQFKKLNLLEKDKNDV